MTPFIHNRSARARGFTLVEVLVALVVLSIGLLGIASLQLSSLRWNHGASLRSQATLLAYDIVDRMRANQVSALAGDYNVAIGASKAAGTVAGDDVIRWKAIMAQTLPNGDGAVQTIPVGTTTTFRITISWDDTHGAVNAAAAAADPTLTFVLDTQI
jgi:type IV pilus assembly protein PilV